ncbi:MAG TPA: EF-hand domain-containing protein [Verrucomicrobiae bacterium]|nr:EF-hand domain-containing protein [Verrucomicrobiae bacterium]
MKRLALLFTIGVSCFLAGVIVTSLWFLNRPPAAAERGSEPAFTEAAPAGGAPMATGHGNARTAKFVALDTDQDGRLSLAEFGMGRSPTESAKWFKRRDADQDGFLSKHEFLPVSAGP